MSSKKKNTTTEKKTVNFKPKTINQNNYVRTIIENDVTLCTGPAGCGKTAVAVGLACSWLNEGRVTRIVITRPIVETGRKGLGFLPGSMQEKVHPYMIPILEEMYKYFCPITVSNMVHQNIIEVSPLEYMRGRNFHNCFMILDEAQNATYEQLKMFATRIGQESKCVINGDVKQTDLNYNDNDFQYFINKIEGIDGVGLAKLDRTDILRSGIIARILSALED
jgi:phosphate starvation-inducible PhoH-like protein